MPRTARIACAHLVALAATASFFAAFGQTLSGVSRLSWLAGCWSSETSEAGSGEQWMQPVAGTMLGTGRTVKAGRTIEFEFMRIHEAPDGRLLYTARPSGQREATFNQLRISESEVAFENPEHDFPQRVIYRRQGDTRLQASIEGTRNGVTRTVEFPMQRAKCEP